jgi:hypothetical protein
MKGFTIFIAILGLSVGYVNAAVAAVVQGLVPTGEGKIMEREVMADSFRFEQDETHTFDETDYTTPTQAQIERGLSIELSDLVPRDIEGQEQHQTWGGTMGLLVCHTYSSLSF